MVYLHFEFPREGRMDQAHHVFAHLKKCRNAELVFDQSDPIVEESVFER